MLKRSLFLAGLVLTVTISATFASEQYNSPEMKQLFSLLPDDAVAVVRLAGIEQGAKHLNDFLLPAAGLPLGGELENIATEALELKTLDGIDKTKPIWIFASLEGDDDVKLALVAPVTDKSTVIEKSELEEFEPGIYNKKRHPLIFRDNSLLVYDGEIPVKMKNWFLNADLNKLTNWQTDQKEDLSLWINNDKLTPFLKEISEELIGGLSETMSMAPFMSANVVPMLEIEVGWILDLMDQISITRLDIQLSAEQAQLRKRVSVKPVTPFAEYINIAKMVDSSKVISLIKPADFVSAVMNIDPKLYEMTKDRFLSDFEKLDMPTDGFKKIMEDIEDIYTGPIGLTMNVAEQSKNPMALTELIEIKDAKKALEAFDSMAEIIQSSAGIMQPATGVKIEVEEEKNIGTYKDISYSKLGIRYKFDDPESPLAEMMKMNDIDYYYAIYKDLLVFTSEDMPKVLDRLMQNVDVTDVKKMITPDAFLWARINVLEGINFAKAQMSQVLKGGINPLLMIEVPKDAGNPGLTIDAYVEDGDMVSRLIIPVKEITAVKNAVLGSMMKQNSH